MGYANKTIYYIPRIKVNKKPIGKAIYTENKCFEMY